MSTPHGGGDPYQGTPSSGNAGFSSPPPPPPPPSGSTDYGQVAPSPGQSYGGAPTGQLAGFWIRLGGALIDGILLSIVAFVIALAFGGMTTNTRQLISTALGAVYFTYFHGSTGQSLGQKLVNIKVVDQESGGNIDYVRAFIRWAVSIVSGLALAIGYLWMLWDKNNQTWHDKASKALVVKT